MLARDRLKQSGNELGGPEIAGREMRDSIVAIDNAQARCNDLQTK